LNYPISLGGNWTHNGTFQERNGTITFIGTNDQTINAVSNEQFYDMVINKASGKVTMNISLQTHNFTLTAGTLETDIYPLSLYYAGGTFSISNGATLKNWAH
jgi:hypothetical protein